MEQSIYTLNIPKTKLTRLHSLGTYYVNDMTKPIIETLQQNIAEVSQSKTALDLLEEELTNQYILSFNIELDKILTGEITPHRIVELAGPPGSGKTQICFQLSVTTQLPISLGGLNGQVAYLCTNKNFSPTRVQELSQKLLNQFNKVNIKTGLTCKDFLRNIFVFNLNNPADLSTAVKYLDYFLRDKKIKLVIIDNISNPLRKLKGVERTAYAYTLLNELQMLSRTFGFAILITNDFTTKIKDNEVISAPSFGDSFLDRVNTRICLYKQPECEVYTAELLKSSCKSMRNHLGNSFCMF
ncbi:DNA repair protein RAD51 homolog 3-like [Anthonomus grandis grandis]|uniref:DNA repair protein RAD51 homolog 3-like n=1 Tax=Anthonomus grandis grandis TaxID=2921223 RepID=UPI0021667C4E|nr:DNA repair protein RAD51 homolog 3-like [Anthonomus grandis grandis]XP_050301219.1 DNA repair protein RAD51 homolog 3-like [Anthonomus grandis grandis]XP_050301220.1 DNA repair protein RAD51 homolog 3-like [Anthonomus grandis grandis]